MRITTIPLGPLQTNCYILDQNGEAVAVDMGGEPDPVLHFLREHNLRLTHVLCTHLHFDHTYGLAALQKALDVTVLAGEADDYMLQSELGRGGIWSLPKVAEYTFTPLNADTYTFLGVPCRALPTPGHSPGSFSFYFEAAQAVFCGDVLFQHSVGRTDLPGGDHAILMESILQTLYTLPEETTVYPGHGAPTTIHSEKLNNPFVSEFTV